MNCILQRRRSFLSSVLLFKRTFSRLFNPMEVNRNKLFVRYGQNDELMRITFNYGDNVAIKEREFNFIRNKSESLEVALGRIHSKIVAAALPKSKKKHKKLASVQVGGSQTENEEPFDVSLCVTFRGQKVDMGVPNSEAWTDETRVQIGDAKYEVIVNGPEISILTLPKTILGGYMVYPRLCLEFANKEDSIFTWYRSVDKEERKSLDDAVLMRDKKGQSWLKVSDTLFYLTSEKDIGHQLKLVCLPKHGSRCGKSIEVISTNPVVAGPGKCPFEDRHEFTKNITPVGSIRCVSYNILADLYADSETARNELFAHCPPEYLDFEYRKQLYLKEITGYNADIICLQEVDHKVFINDLDPFLSTVGLMGIYNKKGGQVVEGLACFFRSSKFRVVQSEGILLNEAVSTKPELKDIWDKVSENNNLKERLLARTTALQVVLLECLDTPGRQILVGNTHLYFHPESDNIRLIQAAICIRYLEHLMEVYEREESSTMRAVMLCGDFNSCPEFGVLHLMTQGSLPEECMDWQSNPTEAVPGLPLKHRFFLASGCGTPPYTNFTQGFNGCLDYIFYDTSHFTVTDVVPLPTHEQVTKHVALPNKEFPSDHIALICTLKWK